MTAPVDEGRRNLLRAAFQMPLVQTMVSRKSSITNAFVNAIIPAVLPTVNEIDKALENSTLGPSRLACAYCGAGATEWDHLRPLVANRRPTGFISEISNLVPACAKCNQSKGGSDWRKWMLGRAKLSPTGRGVPGTAERVANLDCFVQWRPATRIDFELIVGRDQWERYWSLCEAVIDEMRRCQEYAGSLRARIIKQLAQDDWSALRSATGDHRPASPR